MRVALALNADAQHVAAEARRAEQHGYDAVALGEHLFFHGPTPNAFVTLAAAAGATSSVRLLSSVALLPLYPAALAAKLAASLDGVSAGRFDLGVGVGGEYPPEFEAAGVPVAERGPRTDEALEVMTRLWSGEKLDFAGRFTRVPGLALDPPPVQPGGPSIWLGGRRPAAIRRAGRFADVWMPYMYDPERLATSLGQVRAEAQHRGRDPDSVRGAIFCWGAVDPDGQWARRQAIDVVSQTYQQDFTRLADKYLLLGTPDQVIARLREYADAGADTLVFSPAGTGAARDRIVITFTEQVLPAARSL